MFLIDGPQPVSAVSNTHVIFVHHARDVDDEDVTVFSSATLRAADTEQAHQLLAKVASQTAKKPSPVRPGPGGVFESAAAHGGLHPPSQKSTYPQIIDFRAVVDVILVTLHADFRGREAARRSSSVSLSD